MHVVQQLEQRLAGDGLRVVRLPLRLLDDHLELLRELLRIDHRIRVRVALDVESAREARGGKNRVVARVIVDGAGVQISARRLGLLRDGADGTRRRPLEEHVLEHVRDADDVVALIEVAGLHEGDDRNYGRGVVAPQKHGEPVGEDDAPHRCGIEQSSGCTRGAHWWRRRATTRCSQRTIRSSPAFALPRMKLSASLVGIFTPVSEYPRRASLDMYS